VKEFWKSVNIWGSYGQEFSVLFFDLRCSLVSGFVHFKCVLQLRLFLLIHNNVETISVFAVHTDAVLLKQQRMFVVGAKREQVC